ncbi:hypothetical protein FNV43_RR22350 [Rhamnella rubrinervis]|uniref:WRKY domain-containing protein n=1 Tax=Rhamnella rubrinervis TaxID=2594499 RepID=A0A8K0DU56_9ROSA|nr:hypothetical protein FNV43_RR22350 [Rhamnella rubrinervis]
MAASSGFPMGNSCNNMDFSNGSLQGDHTSLNGFLGLRTEKVHVLRDQENPVAHHDHKHRNSTADHRNSTADHDEARLLLGKTKKGEKKIKKPRYAFQTRSQVDILDDGYRWRKYGQKAVKNNKFPRSYYRCTYQGCHVKKQVQRLTKDEGIVVTTYEGMHSHPIDKPSDNFEHILSQMQIYTPF